MLYLRFYLHTDDAGRSSPFAIDVERIDYEEGEDEESGRHPAAPRSKECRRPG